MASHPIDTTRGRWTDRSDYKIGLYFQIVSEM